MPESVEVWYSVEWSYRDSEDWFTYSNRSHDNLDSIREYVKGLPEKRSDLFKFRITKTTITMEVIENA